MRWANRACQGGRGHIYRRFPSKDALLDALAAQITDEMEKAASEAHESDDGHGLEAFLEYVGRSNASKRRYSAVLLERVGDRGVSEAMAKKIRALTNPRSRQGCLPPMWALTTSMP